MKAAIFKAYGFNNPIEIQQTETPSPTEHQIRIKVKATPVTAVDAIFRSGSNLFARMTTGLRTPKIKTLGTELSGVVEAVGEKVSGFKVGDEVIADSGTHYGAHAEYVVVSGQDPIVHKPEHLSFQEAAAVSYGALTALPFLRDHGKIKRDHNVLVIGASGGVGTYAVQLAHYFGAEVTGVCSSNHASLVTSLGAHHIIDYRETPLSGLRGQFDIIFDTVGKYSFGKTKHLLKPEGRYLTTVLNLRSVFDMLRKSPGRQKSILAFTGLRNNKDKTEDLRYIAGLFSNRQLKAVIDREYGLDEISEAYDYVAGGHKAGSVVINMENMA